LIHEVIMPMRSTSNDVLDNLNLWLIDERLAFHDFLASDKPLSSMPIVQDGDAKEPDLVALNVFDAPLLVAEGQRLPLASIVVVEIKRPMRNDAASGEDKDLSNRRSATSTASVSGKTQTASGRPIPRSEEIPGFCYVVCDITPSVEKRCKLAQLTVTSDRQGYFGYNPNYRAYIEVLSYDRLPQRGARAQPRILRQAGPADQLGAGPERVTYPYLENEELLFAGSSTRLRGRMSAAVLIGRSMGRC
jgi:hypothetical protein